MEAIRSSETSVHIRSTRRHIPENGILKGRRRENLKSYKKWYVTMKDPGLLLNKKSEEVRWNGETAATKMENGVDLHGKVSNLKT
jgi:hypothetical protein